MKKAIIQLLVVILIVSFCSMSHAEENVGFTTPLFLTMFEGFLNGMGVPVWPLEMNDSEVGSNYITKVIVPNLTLYVEQREGMVTEFSVITDTAKHKDDTLAQYLIFCIMGSLMIIDLEMSGEDAFDYTSRIITGEEIMICGWRYVFDRSPLTTLVRLHVSLANEVE